jgi:radical SAM protein with 4Fe4S-binding SPASM domain
MSKDNFCIVPWIHLNTQPNGNVKTCCAYHGPAAGNLKDNTLEEIWNNEHTKSMRTSFLQNKIPNGCLTCTKKEDSGGISYRMAVTERFKQHIEKAKANTLPDGTYETFEIIYWDFRFSNICNFKCRMCGHYNSSAWWDDFTPEEKKTKIKFLDSSFYGTDLMKYVDQFIDSVEEIYFAGGEPLLMAEHYQILDKLIAKERYDVCLRYNTNMSTLKYKNYDLIDIWKRFKKVMIFVSIDGVDENAEYSRAGTDWLKVEENLKKLSVSKVDYVVSSTINIFNVFNFTHLVDRLIKLKISVRRLLVSHVNWPNHYMTSVLPEELKDQVRSQLDQHLEKITPIITKDESQWIAIIYSQIKFYLISTTSPDETLELQKKFKRETIKLDAIRKEDFKAAVPELAEWFTTL